MQAKQSRPANYQPTFVELVQPVDVEFERQFDQLLKREKISPLLTEGNGKITQHIYRFIDKVDDIVDQTGIPNLIFKVEQRSFEALSSIFNRRKG